MAREQPRGASIVIPTTMRRDSVAPVVDAALAAVDSMPGGEVIVVANGPAVGRRSLELRSPALRVIECEIPRTAAARNLGLREAANDIVIFTDDDCLVSPEWVATVATRLHGQPAVATPLKMRLDGPVTTFLDYQRIFDPRPIDAETVHFGIGASIGVRRDLIPALFDEDLKAGDDVQLLAGAIAENLKRTAALTAGAENHPDIDRGGDQVRRQADEVWTSVNGTWGEVREGAVAADVDAIARRMRADGVSFREGMQTMETIAFGAVGSASRTIGGHKHRRRTYGDERPAT